MRNVRAKRLAAPPSVPDALSMRILVSSDPSRRIRGFRDAAPAENPGVGMSDEQTITLTRNGPHNQLAQVDIPRNLGSLHLGRELGRGGMGVVYHARDRALGRDVAVKFLLNIRPDGDSRFDDVLTGVRATASLRHPNLNAVYHADCVAGIPFLVMEFVDGSTLSQVLKRSGPLAQSAALVILREIAGGVIELHARNVVHRDIKPANVLIEHDGRTLVTDFGLACRRQLFDPHQQPVDFAGTPAYMAPEMFEGIVSPKTDVYSLGITLFELLTAAPPFSGSLETLARHHRETALPADKLAARGVSDTLIDILERATHKNHLFRLKSAAHLMAAIENEGLMPPRGATVGSELGSYLYPADRDAVREDHDRTPTTPPTAYYDTLASAAARKRAHRPNIPPPPPLNP